MLEATVVGQAAAAIILELLEDVLKAGGDGLAWRDREAETHGLPIIVVWILQRSMPLMPELHAIPEALQKSDGSMQVLV